MQKSSSRNGLYEPELTDAPLQASWILTRTSCAKARPGQGLSCALTFCAGGRRSGHRVPTGLLAEPRNVYVPLLQLSGRYFAPNRLALALAVPFTYVKAGWETRACLALAKTAGAPDAELLALLEADSLADEGSYEVALSAYRATRSSGGQRRSWTRRGEAYCLRHLFREQESLAAYEEACQLSRLGGSEPTVSVVRRDIVSLLVSQAMRSNGDRRRELATRALAELRELIPGIRATGDLLSLANAIRHRGRGYTALGRLRAGETNGRRALELFTTLGDERGKCIASRSVAESLLAQGRKEAAQTLLMKALLGAERRSDEPERLKVRALLESSCALQEGRSAPTTSR